MNYRSSGILDLVFLDNLFIKRGGVYVKILFCMVLQGRYSYTGHLRWKEQKMKALPNYGLSLKSMILTKGPKVEHDVNKKLSMKYSPRFIEIVVNMGMVVRDCFEDRPSYSETANTHDYGIKILLINRLRNR